MSDDEPHPDARYVNRHLPRHIRNTLSFDSEDLAYSYFLPSAYWTPDEKARLFSSLARHSRLRPDLIAADVHSKSEVDVALYLDLLHTASSSSPGPSRSNFPIAHEAPDDLVAYEDEQSARLARHEPAYAAHARDLKRRAERDAFQAPLRRAAAAAAKEKGKGRDRVGEQERRAKVGEWEQGKADVWRREDILAALDVLELSVLDRVLREDEDARYEHDDAAAPPPPPAPVPATTVDDSLIDPVLLAESQRARLAAPTAPPALTLTPEPSRPSTPDPADPNLSPASRRRLKKRMYMRRKRAEKTGGEASTSVKRLKPGRKPKDSLGGVTRASTPTSVRSVESAGPSMALFPDVEEDDDEEEEEEEEDGGKRKKRPNKGGLTRPYKFRRTLDELGVDASFMREHGLGLFNHASLGRLMLLHGEIDGERPDEVPIAIDADAIGYLEALVKDFTARAVAMAVTVRELDFRLKRHTKVWRLGKYRHILARHVQAGLEMLGHPNLSKYDHFGAMAGRLPGVDPSEVRDGAPKRPRRIVSRPRKKKRLRLGKKMRKKTKPGAGSATEERTGVDGYYRWPDRKMAQPFVYVPDVPECYPYGVEAKGTRPVVSVFEGRLRAQAEKAAALDLMLDETDEDALGGEIEDEDALDEEDAREDRRAIVEAMRELGLVRGSVGGVKPPPSTRRKRKRPQIDSESEEERRAAKRGRKKMKGYGPAVTLATAAPDGVHIKSAAMIEDSDEMDSEEDA